MDAEIHDVGGIRIGVEFSTDAKTSIQLLVRIIQLALDLPFQLVPPVVDQHIVFDIFGADADQVAGVLQISMAIATELTMRDNCASE